MTTNNTSVETGQYLPTDTTPEQLFQAIGRLRKDARDEIHRLIQFPDTTDDYVARELEDDGDQGDQSYPEGLSRMCTNPIEDDEDGADDEPNLGSLQDSHQQRSWASGNSDDREGDEGYDDREGDELQHGGDEHDGCEPDEEGEPSLGWTVDGVLGATSDYEADASYATPAAYARYRLADRWSINDDGRHVDADRMIATGLRRLMNLSAKQRAAVWPRLDRTEVRL